MTCCTRWRRVSTRRGTATGRTRLRTSPPPMGATSGRRSFPCNSGACWTICGRTATGWSATLSSGMGGTASSSPPCMTGATQRTSAWATRSLSSWLADVRRSWEPSGQTSMWCSRRMWTSGRLTTPSPRFGWSCRGTWMQTPSMRWRIG